MPSDESLLSKAEEYKTQGNQAFQNGATQDAIAAYSQGIVVCDRMIPVPKPLKATLLSNRAMCYLKVLQLPPCIDDCTMALEQLDPDIKLRPKLLYRRAKARFLLSNVLSSSGKSSASTSSTTTSTGDRNNNSYDLLQDAGKDLLEILQIDPKNADANQLLLSVRAQHKQTQTASTPVSRTLQALREDKDTNHHVKLLLGLLDNDLSNASMELGRLQGVSLLFDLARSHAQKTDSETNTKTACLAAHCLSQAGSHPPFVRTYLKPVEVQAHILQLVADPKVEPPSDMVVSLLACYVRIILHLDRDDPEADADQITAQTGLDYSILLQTCSTAMTRFAKDKNVLRAVLDVLSMWTAGNDRDASIRASLAESNYQDPLLPLPVTQAEIRAMTPQQLAHHRKLTKAKRDRDEAWAFDRARRFIQDGTLQSFLTAATTAVEDHVVRREMTVVMGRILAQLQEEDKIKELVRPFVNDGSQDGKKDMGVIIEEVHNDDGDEEKQVEEEEEEVASLEKMMERAMITSALLLSKKEVGAWALGTGWVTSTDDLPALINSGNSRAMCLASEVVSGAATVEGARVILTKLMSSGDMQKLIMSDDRDIRSGAASAIAKLGLSDKETGRDEGELIGMLQGACDLLEDSEEKEEEKAKESKDKLRHFSSFATSSVERGIEMVQYLVANTIVKDEIAAGFSSSPSSVHSALERLVELTSLPNVGESLSGFGLATIFQNMAVTNLQLRKEMFEGKEVTMEQYDEMQKMGKTEEEKDLIEQQKDTDTEAACNERIRKMASANVPRALVALTEGASEHTLEQLFMAMNRMAGEQSVRGIMIQLGVLSACIKVEKNEGPTETDTMRNVIRLARHCIAKMLVSTNPSLLTSAQRLGSIRPLLKLVRDIKASDLQHFEALLAITNLASSGEDAQNRIVSERGIPALNFAMFSDHEMVQRAATEAMCNLVPHKGMMDHLSQAENLKLWLAFASDYEEHYECARAASGCLAMATQDEAIARELVSLEKFGSQASSLLESGRLEIMHRALVLINNLMIHGGDCREKAVKEGLVAFCQVYVEKYHDGQGTEGLEFPEQEVALLPVTVDIAKKIVLANDS